MVRKILCLCALVFVACATGLAQQPPKTQLKVGDRAPDFTLTDTAGNPVKLSDFRGKKNVVLAFTGG